MHDRRALISLVLGVVGGLAGVGGLLTGSPLALIAGICALGAGLLHFLGASKANPEVSAAAPVSVAQPANGFAVPPMLAPPSAVAGPVVHAMGQPMLPDMTATMPPMPVTAVPPMPQAPAPTQPPAPAPFQMGAASDPTRPEMDSSLVDPHTGLYTESYLMVALDARIAAARRRLRPVSVVMIDVVYGLHAGNPVPADSAVVSAAVRSTLREADTAACMNDGRFVLVLEDTPENGAIWTVERLRSYLVADHPDHTVRAGIACYPAHAFNLEEILQQANEALANAREWRQDRIEVASSD